MSVSIALAVSPECEIELQRAGFRKEEVWVKFNGDLSTEANRKKRESEFWHMKHIPYQFVVTDFWGAGPD